MHVVYAVDTLVDDSPQLRIYLEVEDGIVKQDSYVQRLKTILQTQQKPRGFWFVFAL